jgi:hypothetical protein
MCREVSKEIFVFSRWRTLGQTKGLVLAPRPGTGELAGFVASSRPTVAFPDSFGDNFTLELYVIGADTLPPLVLEPSLTIIPTGAPHPGNNSGSLAVTPDGHYAFRQSFQLGPIPFANLLGISNKYVDITAA